ncbi:phage tail protein [Ancylobacter rudongensis]|uniref:Microcystin-dependent protein n=1 Tax=Ancylobacter rudongensis TaxID=177413 RepID=A0A1G4QL19_9HYPH|nr:tail fiber protein [Ancylobacter rudongensis]SCW45333.1 Microcystin-dependent protein [Ancylobacter rudongensis]
MVEAYLGEVRFFAFKKVPRGWVRAEGQELLINSNQALFALIGDVYGGDGKVTFKLPDLRGRVPLGLGRALSGKEYEPGKMGGDESVVLTAQTMPAHQHYLAASTDVGKSAKATGATIAAVDNDGMTPPNDRLLYTTSFNTADLVSLNQASLSSTGGGASHPNMQPFAVGSYCICTNGVWPDRW